MGIYVYTLRKNPIKVAGMEIARYGYAYKEGWGASETAKARRLVSSGYRAQEEVGHLDLYIQCSDVKDIGEKREWMVMKRNAPCLLASFDDEIRGDMPVGYLVRRNHKLVFEEI